MISNQVKSVLQISGKMQIELAEYFGMSKQSMSNKMTKDSWSAKDLARVAAFTGAKLAFIMPDGSQINIEQEKASDE